MTMLCQLNKKCINYLIDRLARIVQIRKRISVSKKTKKFFEICNIRGIFGSIRNRR